MKNSDFNRLIERYVTQRTSATETAKIEAMLKAIKTRRIQFLSEETEQLLFWRIIDYKTSPKQIARLVGSFSKLRVPGINWMRLSPFEVYFYKELIQ
jgi:hypothetical protein